MVEAISMGSIGLMWKVLAKAPIPVRWLLRWRFPIQRCRGLVIIDPTADSVYFDLHPEHPSHYLGGIGLKLHNHLPFDVVVKAVHAALVIDSTAVLDAVLNSESTIPASNSAQLLLPQLGLTEQQVRWVRNLQREFTRIKLVFDLKIQSDIRSWEEHSTLVFSATINSGSPSAKQGVSR